MPARCRAPRGWRPARTGLVLALILAAATAGAQPPAKLDLNRATRDEIRALPIPAEVADAIYEYRTFVRFFGSVYDVADVRGVTPEILAALRPLVSTLPPETKDEVFQRYDASFRQVQQFLSQEGSSEELADEYLDLLRDPRNVNRLNLYDLQSFQNVSPVDAVAILEARALAGRIENARQLRTSDGLSYWGFRNLRDYLVYEDPEGAAELHGDVQVVAFNTPYLLDERDILLEPLPGTAPGDFATGTAWGIRGLDAANPAVITKLRLRLGGQWKGGLATIREVGEEQLAETVKGFASWTNPQRGALQIDKVVAGNFRIAMGQGLVMDNTDYFLPRKTGFGFNVRPRSILGDLSRSHEFALRGIAAEATAGPFRAQGFVSRDKKDGLVNPDGTLNKYVVMAPRFENHELASMQTETGIDFGLRRDAFRETMFGGNLKAELWTGTYVGVSGWEARYDKPWNPDINTLVPAGNLGLLNARDSELFRDYDSRQLGDFRRVFGAEFQTVYENVSLQGEYAKLDANPANGLEGLLSAAPEAYTVNAYVQYEDLNLLALWRDYDLGFDNPYARAFSNDVRYEQTLLDDPFRLQNPLLSFLGQSTPQMKPERGLFVALRYRVTRNFTITGLEFDDWTRAADGQDLRRYTARLEYAPIFPLRFRLRQRFSSRSEFGSEDVRKFRGWDTRLETRVRLSTYDELSLLYSTTKTEFAPRPRLVQAAEPGVRNPLPQGGSPSQAVQAVLTHNVNEHLMFEVSTQLYDGFLYNFEDNEFVVVDDVGFRNYFLVRSRLSDAMLLRFKLTHDRLLTRNNIDVRSFENPYGFLYEGDNTRAQQTSFRLQLDYTF